MVWFKYGSHDYMDEKPEFGFRLLESRENAEQWAQHMCSYGYPTWICGPATKAEVLSYIEQNHIKLDELTRQNVNNDDFYQK